MTGAALHGLLLGLALITPIGAQNLFVLSHALRRSPRSGLVVAALAAG